MSNISNKDNIYFKEILKLLKEINIEISSKTDKADKRDKINNIEISKKILFILINFIHNISSVKFNKEDYELYKIILNFIYKILSKLSIINDNLTINEEKLKQIIKQQNNDNEEFNMYLYTLNHFLLLIKLYSLIDNKSLSILVKYLKKTKEFPKNYNSNENQDISVINKTIKEINEIIINSKNITENIEKLKEYIGILIKQYNSFEYIFPSNKSFNLISNDFTTLNNYKIKLRQLIIDLWNFMKKYINKANNNYDKIKFEVDLINSNELYDIKIPYKKEISKKFLFSIKEKIPFNNSNTEKLKKFINFHENTFNVKIPKIKSMKNFREKYKNKLEKFIKNDFNLQQDRKSRLLQRLKRPVRTSRKVKKVKSFNHPMTEKQLEKMISNKGT